MAYQFECTEPDCGFLIRSRSNEEVIQLARSHVRNAHDGEVDSADIDGGIDRSDTA